MDSNYQTLVLVALFALLFAVVGWTAPATYAAYAPQDHYIETHNFTVNDAKISDAGHTLCYERTIYHQSVGEVFTELYLVSEDGDRIEVSSERDERVFQEGRRTVRITVDVPEDIEKGTYKYERIYNMELANGRVDRQFSFTSEAFTVTNGDTVTSELSC